MDKLEYKSKEKSAFENEN